MQETIPPIETEASSRLGTVLLVAAIVVPLAVLGFMGYFYIWDVEGVDMRDGAVWATVTVDMGDGRVYTHNVTTNYTTAYGFLLAVCAPEHANLTVTATYYAMFDSLFVETVGDMANGQDNNYWQYWVNGQQTMDAADKIQINDGDVILWSFQEMSF